LPSIQAFRTVVGWSQPVGLYGVAELTPFTVLLNVVASGVDPEVDPVYRNSGDETPDTKNLPEG
jgi:hypothetical protein